MQTLVSDAEFEKLKGAHPDKDVVKLTVKIEDLDETHQFIVKVPGRPEWKKFRKEVANEATRGDAAEHLMRDCTIYPEAKDLDALLVKRAGLAESVGGKLASLAGGGAVEAKK